MGLLSNLRVLIGSDIGDRVREAVRVVRSVESRLDELEELNEMRYRRLNKRWRDQSAAPAESPPEAQAGDRGAPDEDNPRIARLRARRARRTHRLGLADLNGTE